jgi:hypothetical protein
MREVSLVVLMVSLITPTIIDHELTTFSLERGRYSTELVALSGKASSGLA